jgi:hypothetical protein
MPGGSITYKPLPGSPNALKLYQGQGDSYQVDMDAIIREIAASGILDTIVTFVEPIRFTLPDYFTDLKITRKPIDSLNRISMREEMLTVEDLDTGRFKGLVLMNAADEKDTRGYVHIPASMWGDVMTPPSATRRAVEGLAIQAAEREERRGWIGKPVPAQRVKGHKRGRFNQEAVPRQHHSATRFGPLCETPGACVDNHFHLSRPFAKDRTLHVPIGRQELVLGQLHLRREFIERRKNLVSVLDKPVKGMQPLGPAVVGPRENCGIACGLLCRGSRCGQGCRLLPVKVRRDVMVVERSADAEVVENVVGRLGNVEAIFPVEGDAVPIDNLKQRHRHSTYLFHLF